MGKSRLGIAILAAGSSRRFGETDKLAATFRGRRLGEHVCGAIPREWCAHRWVIAARAGHSCEPVWQEAGFAVAVNPRADEGMGTSVALAARLALKARCDTLLIALADTPLVPLSHFEALIAACNAPGDVVCSAKGAARMPPAVFGKDRIGQLTTLGGDTGARALLKDARIIACPSQWLADIDTPAALQRLSAS